MTFFSVTKIVLLIALSLGSLSSWSVYQEEITLIERRDGDNLGFGYFPVRTSVSPDGRDPIEIEEFRIPLMAGIHDVELYELPPSERGEVHITLNGGQINLGSGVFHNCLELNIPYEKKPYQEIVLSFTVKEIEGRFHVCLGDLTYQDPQDALPSFDSLIISNDRETTTSPPAFL